MAFEKHSSTNSVKALLAEALLVGTLALLSFFMMSPARADFVPQGGPGGTYFSVPCPAGKYLIGTNGNYGFVVDRISLICAAVNSDGTTGDPWLEPEFHGGPGGSPFKTPRCDNNEVIHGAGLLTGDMPHHVVIRLIVFNCVSTTTNAQHSLDIGTAPGFRTNIPQNCPPGQAATGIQGRWGTYVDAVGLLCGPFIKQPPPPPPVSALGDCKSSHHSPDERIYQLHNDGSVWVRNGQACAGKNCIGGWNMLDSNRATVQIASYCELYQLRNGGVILHYNGQRGQFGNCLNPSTPCDGNWDAFPQNKMIALSGAYGINGINLPPYLYLMHTDNSIWRLNGGHWEMIDGNPATTSIVGGQNGLYQLHNDGKVYRWCGPVPIAGCPGWALLDQSPDPTVMITAGNGLYQMRKSGAILYYTDPTNTPCASATCPNWQLLGTNGAPTGVKTLMIKAGYNGFYQLQSNGWVSEWVRGAWQVRDNHPDTIAITAGQGLYEVRTRGNIYHYNQSLCPGGSVGCDAAFDQIDQNLSSEGVMINGNLAIH
jgi:hypothetical protein